MTKPRRDALRVFWALIASAGVLFVVALIVDEELHLFDACGVRQAEADFMPSPHLIACAEAGNADALYRMGVFYWSFGPAVLEARFGLSAEPTQEEAHAEGLRLLRAAAERGSSLASNEIGVAYAEGWNGLERDYGSALQWLERSSSDGDALAPLNLARLHSGGLGVSADVNVALDYLDLSASRGFSHARCILNSWRRLQPERRYASALSRLILRGCHTTSFGRTVEHLDRRLRSARRSITTVRRIVTSVLEAHYLRLVAATPSPRACTIYRALAEELGRGDDVAFVHATTIDPNQWRLGRFETSSPRVFERRTGEYEERAIDATVFQIPLTEAFELEADIQFARPRYYPMRVDACFDNSEQSRVFWSGSLEALWIWRFAFAEPASPPAPTTGLQFYSQPMYSSDGRYALVEASYLCGGFCGHGALYLLEAGPDSQWVILGFNQMWVS